MDFSHLQSLLQNIESRPQIIKSIVQYVLINNKNNQQEISATIQKQFNSTSTPKQLAILFLVSEILLISNQKRDKTFFKYLAQKLKFFLEVLSQNLQDLRDMKDVCRIIDKWIQQQMFAPTFMEKLKLIISHFYVKIQDQLQNSRMEGFKKYKKTFLMEVDDIRHYSVTSQIYEDYCLYIDLQNKLSNLNLQFNKLDLNSSNQYSKNRSKQLQKVYDDIKQKLQTLVCRIHKSFNNLRKWTIEQLQKYCKQNKIQSKQKKSSNEEKE